MSPLRKTVRSASAYADWFKLDNAAKLYPAIHTGKRASMFRIAAVLAEPVVPALLQAALEEVLPRFPAYAVRLHSGLFWHYFGHAPGCPRVLPDIKNPMLRPRFREKPGFLFRVFWYERRIAVEFFHALADASGVLVFLKTLVAAYLARAGGPGVAPGCLPAHVYGPGLLNPAAEPDPEEFEDAFLRYAHTHGPQEYREPKAYHFASTPEPIHTLHMVLGLVPVEKLLAVARRRKVTITEYLAAVYLDTLLEMQRNNREAGRVDPRRRPLPVRLQVPVNLRRFFPTKSLRNFSFFVNVSIDAANGDYAFDEILPIVHHRMRLGLDKRTLAASIGQNVKPERSLALRLTPLFLKNLAIAEIYRRVGEPTSSGAMSNLGEIEMPPELADAVERFEFSLGPSFRIRTNVAMASYKGTLAITFTSTCRETDLERGFLTRLVRDGIPVKVESNR